MILIKTKKYDLPSFQAIYEFESSFGEIKQLKEVNNRILKKIYQKSIMNKPEIFRLLKSSENNNDYFAVLMAAHDIYKIIPYYFKSRNIYLYIYDLWPEEYEKFGSLIKRLEIKAVFFSANSTKEFFSQNYHGKTSYYWIPEAVKAEEYHFTDYKDKDIDVLSFGRRYEIYHEKINAISDKYKYLYKKDKSPLFPTQNDFTDALSRAKISVCFPTNISHPDTAGNISKITMRYFQSMASKCLILGKAPEEMKEIFDYNPVVEADMNNSQRQIEEILNNYQEYRALIEKNYQELINKHQYFNRIKTIINLTRTNSF